MASQFSSVPLSCPTLCNPMDCSKARLPSPSPTPKVYSNSCLLSWWCHQTISSSVITFSSHLQSFPASGSFPVSQFFASFGQIIGVSASASVLPMNIQGWFPLQLTGLIPGIEPRSPTLQADSSLAEPPGKPKNTGVGSLLLLQGIFLTQESNQGLLHCRWILY